MPAHPLSEAQARETLALVEKHGGNIGAAARAIGAPVETLRSRFRRAQQVVGIGTPPIPPPTPVERQEIQRLKDRVARLQAELADAHRSSIAADDVRREIFRLAETPTPPKWAITPKQHTKTPGMPVLFLSDLHAGEVVDGRVMHGANAYNLDIAERRLRQICTRAADLCLNHMVKPQYPGIVVLFGGDLVSGDIHEELRDTNQSAGVGQAVLVSQWLVAAMRMLADAFKHVWIVCTYGNHARTTVKPRSKADAASNLDWLISQVVASHLRDDKRFTITAPAAPDTMFSIYGTRFLLTHGDKLGVKGGDGIIGAIGPIIRGLKRIADSQATVGAPFDVLLMGHWHQYLPIGRAIVNGSIIGWNEYAKLQLRVAPEAPQQALFFVHPDYGVTNHWAVFAEPGHSRPYNAAHPVALQDYWPWKKS